MDRANPDLVPPPVGDIGLGTDPNPPETTPFPTATKKAK